jgi:glycosyltransferase involved in cell wall biosynthesis
MFYIRSLQFMAAKNQSYAKVSVVMCTFNGAAFIEPQLKSILNQTYPLHELIIADDDSTDDTVALIEQWVALYPCISLHRNTQTLGYTKNFEKAMQLTSGDLIAIADQDDVWHLQKIEVMLREWKEDTLMIYCDSIRFSEYPPEHPQPNRKNRRIYGSNPVQLSVFNTVSGHAAILKKELLALALPISAEVYYDWWLALTAACNGGISFVPDILVFQRIHHQNVTIQHNITDAERAKAYRVMLDKHLSVFRVVKGLNDGQKHFFETLYRLWHRSLSHKINWKLFLLLMRHRHDIYFYKVRKFGFISQFKHSFLFSFRR